MSQQELLAKVVGVLNALRIEFMLTGSVASGLQGEPRSTHDIDLVVALPAPAADRLVEAFPPPDYYLDRQSVLSAIEHRSMFNLLDVNEGHKVDFWIHTSQPFDQSRFSRKYQDELFGLTVHVPAPEDTILMKLRWGKDCGGSEKQFTDALRVYEVQFGTLDQAYLDRWARDLQIEPDLHQLRAAAKATL